MNEMTATTNSNESSSTSSEAAAQARFRRYLGGRRGLIFLTVAVLVIGAYFNWGWLVAAGIAPLLLAFAPCAAMCALGLCMGRMGGKSCSTTAKASDQSADGSHSAKDTNARSLPGIASATSDEGI